MERKLFIFVLLVIVLNGYVTSFQLKSSSILEKQTNVLGVELNYALMDLEFDEEIFRMRSTSCPNYEQCNPNPIDCSCDYTDMNNCGKPMTSSCTNICPATIDLYRVGNISYCGADVPPWETVVANKVYQFETIDYQPLTLRYKANATICESLGLFAYQNQGSISINISPYPYTPSYGRISPITDTTYTIQMNLCPTDTPFYYTTYTADTYVITVIPQSPYAQFTFELVSKETPIAQVENTCDEVLNTHRCLNDGELITGEGQDEEYHYFTYAVKEAQIVAFSFPSLQEDIDFYISNDPSLTTPNSTNQARWVGYNERDDYITLSLEPISATEPLILYIGVSTFYLSNYSFTVTTQSYTEYIPITDGSSKAGAIALVGSSRLISNQGDIYTCNLWSRCSPFSIQFPFTQNLPIWPVPAEYLNDKRFFGIVYEPESNPPQKNSYKVAFLLSRKQGDEKTINGDFGTLMDSKLEFLSTLVNKNLKPLTGIYGYKQRQLECNYNGFLDVSSQLNKEEDTLFSTTDFIKLNSVVFKINTLTLTDQWTSCSNQANGLLQSKTELKQKLTTYCPYISTDPRYITDPCCNSSLTFFSCCVPRVLGVEEVTYDGIRDDLVSSQCSSPECTTSVLDDYQNSLISTSACTVPGFVQEESQLEMRQVLRKCKGELGLIVCNNNSDCGGYTCDLYSRYCLIPAQQQDKEYLKCVFDNLPKTYIFSIIYKHNLNSTTDVNFIDKVFEQFEHQDCTYFTGQFYRSYYEYYSVDVKPYRCYSSPRCLDLSCETVHDVCYDGNFGGWETNLLTNVDQCASIGFCNSLACGVNDTYEQCRQKCEVDNPKFCGYCSSNVTSCYNFGSIPEQTCNNTQICLYNDGEFDNTINSQQICEAKGSCDKPCGYECSGFTGCTIKELNTISLCVDAGALWDTNLGICRYTGTGSSANSTCTSHSVAGQTYIWTDCSTLDFTQCYSHNVGDLLNVCSIQEIPCETKEECENTGGECSDSYFFSAENVPYYPDYFGKCTRGHYIWKSFWPIPTCEIDLEKDSPLGCYPLYFDEAPLDEQTCKNQGPEFKWWKPSSNKKECTDRKGCRILDKNFYNLPYNFRFNQMTQDQCTACGNDVFSSWDDMFTWSPGKWRSASWVNASYLDSKLVLSSKLESLLDYQYLYTELEDSVNIHIADLYRSESLCRMERIEDNIKSISCSCSGEGGSECFTTSSLVLGETKPCQGEESSYTFNNGLIKFDTSSVSFACTRVLVSQISKQLYKSTTPQSLSSSFVSYRKPDNYGVLNSKDAIIGTILSDGIKLSTQGVRIITLCFTHNSNFDSESDKYPVLDFAIEDSNSTQLTPLAVTTYYKDIVDIKYLCAELNITDLSTASVFPIHRIDDWNDKTKEVFDSTAKGLLYTLAVFFTLTSIWGIFQMCVVLYKRYTKLEKIKLVHLLISIVTVFITIRAIYFFILPSGILTNNAVGDYILVVLPTFIYFSSFTVIIVLWYIIVKTKQTGRNLVERLQLIIIVINVILYLLFIIIVLVFHFTESDGSDNCGGRIIVNVSSTTPQRTVSIIYAVIQAVISLFIGAAFIYLGGTLYIAMRYKKVSETSNTSVQQQKIFIITFACSIGFILHCVFVLILVGAEPSNIVFSFLGLIITEIIPSLSIFYSYNQGSLTGIKQNTKSNNLQYISGDKETFASNTNAKSTRG